MGEYQIKNWEKIGENLYRKNSSNTCSVDNIVSEGITQMVNHNDRYILQSEYDEIIDETINQTYENLVRRSLLNNKPAKIKKNLGTIIDIIV